jgi:hypothetical protein
MGELSFPFSNLNTMDFKFHTNPETIVFIEKYLQTNHEPIYTNRNKELIEENWKQINADLYKTNVDENAIQLYIEWNLSFDNYWKFKNTLYWYICSDKIKALNDFLCSNDIRHAPYKLVAHHNSYQNHGREIQHINDAMAHKCRYDIVCICESCHNELHKKENKSDNGLKKNLSMQFNAKEIADLEATINQVKRYDRYKYEVTKMAGELPEDHSIQNVIITQKMIGVELEHLLQLINNTDF